MLPGAGERPAVAALDRLAPVERRAARRARPPDREARRLALHAGSTHERPDLRVRLDRRAGEGLLDLLVRRGDVDLGVARLRGDPHVNDVERLGALDALDRDRQDASRRP